MDNFKIKKKEFQTLSQISDKRFRVNFKNKDYCLIKFSSLSEMDSYLDNVKMFKNSGIPHALVRFKDKKQFIAIEDYLDGRNVLNILLEKDFEDALYEQLFKTNLLARMVHINLEFNPENFIFTSDKKLYYISTKFEKYNEENCLTKKYIRLWFYTKELLAHLKEKGIKGDESRLKEDFVINREVVLKTVKYYR